VPPSSFFPRLREVCNQYGILLIVDEVQSGVARTGKWWAIEHWGVEPDIVCMAKGIASGVPLGGFFGKKSVMSLPTGAHGTTYGGNPIACAAANATLAVLEEFGRENAAVQGAYLLDALRQMAQRHRTIGEVRGLGLMIGVEFVKDKANKEAHPHLRNRVEKLAFEHGLVALGCGTSTLRIIPPLTISRSEVDEGLAILEYVINLAEQG
jgi:4-aminobutyrate aminotransferase